jgi:hypothetical protein
LYANNVNQEHEKETGTIFARKCTRWTFGSSKMTVIIEIGIG